MLHGSTHGNGYLQARLETSIHELSGGLCRLLHSPRLEHPGQTGPSMTRSMEVSVGCKLTKMRGSSPEQGRKKGRQWKLVLC